MKYYSEKLNKLFDTEKELIDAENLPKRLGYWKITLTHYIEELSKADQKLDEELAYCIKEIGEESCDKILDEIFADKAVLKDSTILENKKKPVVSNKKEQEERLSKLVTERDDINKLNADWKSAKSDWAGIINLLNDIFGKDE